MPVFVVAQYARPQWIPFLMPVSLYMALAAGVMAHNHNHCPTFTKRWMNRVFGHWLSIFYGYPTFAWIPTHNQNHHKFLNRPGDATITWRHNNGHGLGTALTYFFVSSYWQGGPIKEFIRKARANNRALYREILSQYALWIAVAVASMVVGIVLHGPGLGVLVWLAATGLPWLFALWTIMLFNYEQHVHTDPWSAHNHSRSWTSPILNFLLFNNGFHAAHHEHPGTHWSQLAAVHRDLEPHIDPRLVENGMWWYFIKCYLLAPFNRKFATQQIGRPPFDVPAEDAVPAAPAVTVAGAA